MTAVSGIITLITDFGLEDPYVGQLKGALLSGFLQATIVDITHGIPRHNIRAAGHALAASYHRFPPGTVHLVVVDPGVGTKRPILAAKGAGHYFIGPDNGVFSLLLADGVLEEVRTLSAADAGSSTTFHGRDIMAPAAAALARGAVYGEIGTAALPEQCAVVPCGVAERRGERIVGEVLRVDHFGNIRTSIRERDLAVFGDETRRKVVITIGEHTVRGISTTYGEQLPGTLCAVIDSDGYLEIALNQGSGAAYLQLDPEQRVEVQVSAD